MRSGDSIARVIAFPTLVVHSDDSEELGRDEASKSEAAENGLHRALPLTV